MKKLLVFSVLAASLATPAFAEASIERNLTQASFKNFGQCNARLKGTLARARQDGLNTARLEKAFCHAATQADVDRSTTDQITEAGQIIIEFPA